MASFLIDHLDEIVDEWETFAGTLSPAADVMDPVELRDHARQMLEAIARDLQTTQSDTQQAQKGKGLAPAAPGPPTPAAMHGLLRQRVGFDLRQLVAEFRALRASVLRIWVAKKHYEDPQAAYELARFNEAIDQALAESVDTYSAELNKSRDTFLGILGHDLRSPLSAVSGALHVVATAPEAADREAAFSAGKRGVAAMSAMIRDLLEYTRARLGNGIPVVSARASLESVCKTAISEISLVHPQSAFRFECGSNLDGMFDVERLQQVIANLLNNAVRYGKRGTPVSMIAAGDADMLRLKVHNFGPPIAAHDLQSIFQPMVRLHPEMDDSRGAQSLGLGLFICLEIVRAHGGALEVESSEKAGTTFTVSLPRAPQENAQANLRAPSLARASG
jgi:signal transduction histidine kinase